MEKTALKFVELNPRRVYENLIASLETNSELLRTCTKELNGWNDLDLVDVQSREFFKDKFKFALQLFEVYPENSEKAPRLIKAYYRDDHPLSISIFFMSAKDRATKKAAPYLK